MSQRSIRIVAGAFVLASLTPTLQSQIFSAVEIDSSQDDPLSIRPGDVDGDGDVDLVTCADLSGTVQWEENVSGDGQVWAYHEIGAGWNGPHTVELADIDADGDLDVAVTVKDDDLVLWLENRVDERADWTEHLIETTLQFPKYVEAGDLDGDGDLDLAVASVNDDTVSWMENVDGVGTSWTTHVVSNLVDAAASVSIGDLDGDGDPDLVTPSGPGQSIFWFENQLSAGTGWVARVVTNMSLGGRRAGLGDLDGDGDLDVLSISAASNTLHWFKNVTGTASVWAPNVISTRVDRVKDLHVGDVNGDGILDVATASIDDGKLVWFKNVGNGTAWVEHRPIYGLDMPSAVRLADANGDGHLDIFYATIGSDQVGCLLRQTELFPYGDVDTNPGG